MPHCKCGAYGTLGTKVSAAVTAAGLAERKYGTKKKPTA
jgi:hypothetical protein